MSWTAVAGQTLAVRLMKKAVSMGKVAHAYLLSGPDGVGKRTAALELAKALNCRKPGLDGDACDSCSSCQKIQSTPVSHPDVMIMAPDGRFIRTDQVRNLQVEMYARPTEGKARVAIVDGADRMNQESGNRLLKLLEEPPPHAVLILLTANLAGVLPTLVSRCQIVNFTPLSTELVANLLEQRGIQRHAAKLFGALSGGSVGRALTMAISPEVGQLREDTFKFLRGLPDLDDVALLGFSEALEKHRETLEDWFDIALVCLRDSLLVSQSGTGDLIISADRAVELKELAYRYSPTHLITMIEGLTAARERIQRNANVRLALDVLILRLGDAARETTTL